VSGSEEESSGAASAAGRLLSVLGALRDKRCGVDFEGFVEALARHAAELKRSPEALDVLVAALPAFANVSNPKIAQALLLGLWSYLDSPDDDSKWERFLEVLGTVSLTIGSGKRVATEVWSSVEARLKTPAGELGLKREKLGTG